MSTSVSKWPRHTYIHREWAMPNRATFSIPPIKAFVRRYLVESKVSCDPFARNCRWATHTNDIDPSTKAEHHFDAVEFIHKLTKQKVRCDLAILDPPYSPRQISECYRKSGLLCGQAETQNSKLLRRVRAALVSVLVPDAVVLSFGWNSAGMGQGWRFVEVLLVCHGGAHNDTICVAQKRSS